VAGDLEAVISAAVVQEILHRFVAIVDRWAVRGRARIRVGSIKGHDGLW
jgi:hypothetical protein